MHKTKTKLALIAALAAATAVPVANAGQHARGHHIHDRSSFVRGGGTWIVTPVGAARDANHGNCYTRFGRTFCE
jgi:hypothetical protein